MAKRNVSYIKPAEPKFLRKLKEQVGYKEGPTVDTKREKLPADNEDDKDSPESVDDEKPVVVVLKKGDLTEEEANQYLTGAETDEQEIDEGGLDKSGKLLFRKPQKRSGDDSKSLKKYDKKQKTPRKVKEKKNKSLLSFDEEENDD